MKLPLLRAFTKTQLFVLTLISSPCLGDICGSGPNVVESPSSASILRGQNHTFSCKGIGSFIDWQINGYPIYNFSEEKIKVVDIKSPDNDGDSCTQEFMMTVHAESASEDNTLSTFTVQCVIKNGGYEPVVSEAYLKVHVIGEAGDVELISPASPQGYAMMQWEASDVLSGSSSPLYYNLTVIHSSTQVVIAQTTTTDTSYAIDSDLLVPCDSYQLTILPFQQFSSHTELGIMTQTSIDYSGTPLPATDVKFSVSMQPDSAQVTIYFQAQNTSCSLQRPEKFTVTVMQQGTNMNQISAKQTVLGVVNEYTLEKLDLRQKYWVSIKLESDFSSSVPEIANFSTFDVQNLTLKVQEEKRELNVHCEMAKGAQDRECIVEMRNETMQHNCIPSSGTNTSCTLGGLSLGKYMIWGYDREYRESPAVKQAFFFTKELNGDATNTMPTINTDDTATSERSRSGDEEAVQTDIIVGILAPLSLVIVVAGIVSFVIVIVIFRGKYRRNQKIGVHDSEVPENELYVYQTAEENEYDEHSPPWQQNAVGESAGVQESAYAQPQLVISTTAPTNNSSNQYKQHRKEWLEYLPPEGQTLSHTNLVQTPEDVSL